MRRADSLRGKTLALLALVALVPALLLGAVAVGAVRGLGGLARDRARAAVEQEVRQRLLARAEQQARAEDAVFEGVRAQAVTLARYAAWYYDHPENLPQPGFLRGGSPLEQTPEGHWVNREGTPTGVFLSRRAPLNEAVWREVGTLSFMDPLLTSIAESTPGAARAWVISATRIARVYPNQNLGHRGSPVGPDYDLTEDEPFQAAGPERNPSRSPVWTAPYADPVTATLMVTAAVPIYGRDGRFRAVAGVDMPLADVLDRIERAQAEPGAYAFLLDREARVISAPDAAWAELGLRPANAPVPGRAAVASLEESAVPGVRELALRLRGVQGAGIVSFRAAGGPSYAGFAPLPATGWVLAWMAPAGVVEAAAAGVQSNILRLERGFLAGGVAALLLTLAIVAAMASRASSALTRPVSALLEGTRRLATDLSYRLSDLGRDELGQLARAFNRMADSLERSRAEAVRNARMIIEERQRLARDIHDTIAQNLAGVVVHLENVEDVLDPAVPPEASRHLARARELARDGLREARRSVWNLRPQAVEEAGLAAALRALADGLRHDGVACELRLDSGTTLSADVEDALYRVSQEAFANIRRHSGAKRASISLSNTGDHLVLRIADDGRGFDAAALARPGPGGGYGLWSMRERLANVGGELLVESGTAGTTLTATLPTSPPAGSARGRPDHP